MVLIAWLVTIISVIPQAVIFRVLRHPEIDYYQCTTEDFFESLTTETVVLNNVETHYLPGGLTPKQAADLYHTIFNCQVSEDRIKSVWFFLIFWIFLYFLLNFSTGFFDSIICHHRELHQDISGHFQVTFYK